MVGKNKIYYLNLKKTENKDHKKFIKINLQMYFYYIKNNLKRKAESLPAVKELKTKLSSYGF